MPNTREMQEILPTAEGIRKILFVLTGTVVEENNELNVIEQAKKEQTSSKFVFWQKPPKNYLQIAAKRDARKTIAIANLVSAIEFFLNKESTSPSLTLETNFSNILDKESTSLALTKNTIDDGLKKLVTDLYIACIHAGSTELIIRITSNLKYLINQPIVNKNRPSIPSYYWVPPTHIALVNFK